MSVEFSLDIALEVLLASVRPSVLRSLAHPATQGRAAQQLNGYGLNYLRQRENMKS
jgi:hypothetical protein